ncbi:PAS domain-containing sensor histidine kinase [Desulfosediminicola flagellatus]|uniref:PAS domain-containing sensor histidine kinase n=1 Tax=Desulfosediminicola flagellatus TaxID=2569541 RepID=UPI0010ABC841|nr:PAS domain S-box protein [Desulfosediminicola flagellatus]
MGFIERFSRSISSRLIAIGIALGALSWLVESFIHSHFFYDQHLDFMSNILFPDIHELWMRLIIVVLFISFAFYAQRIVKALRAAEMTVTQINMELTQIFDTSADGMRVIDKNFNILRANSTFLELAGVSRTGIQGRKCYEVFKGESCQTKDCPMVRIQRGEGRVEYDGIKICQNGRQIPCIITATPFRDSEGKLVGIVEDFKDISERKSTEQALRRSHEQLRNVISHIEMVREEERRGMAREIHDELGQALTCLKMDVHWLTGHLSNEDENIYEKLHIVNQQIDATVHTVQRISSELRPRLLDDLGLSAAIEWQAGRLRDRLGITIEIISEPENINLSEACSITIFRIFQEALTNIARHAEATRVEIVLNQNEGQVTLTVSDNGKGISRGAMSNANSLGLLGMHERACLLDGLLEIQSEPGQGTTVLLNIPYQKCRR